MGIAIVALQCIGIIYLLGNLVLSFVPSRRENLEFATRQIVIEIILTLLLGLCILFYELSGFNGEPHFFEFAVITTISVAFFWVSKLVSANQFQVTLVYSLVATLFWLSLFTTIKFGIYLPFLWFPLLGLFAATPLLIVFMSLSRLIYASFKHSFLSLGKLLPFGLIPLVILQFIMNMYTKEPWELIKIFSLETDLI